MNGALSDGDVYFYTSASNGGLEIIDGSDALPLVDQVGAQLFTGSVLAPTFRTETFSLSTYDDQNVFNQDLFLTILPGNSVTPEPGILLLVGTGLLSAIVGLGRRRLRC